MATARLRDPVLLKLVAADRLGDLAEIEGATSGRRRAQERGADQLDPRELVFAIPHAYFINAAFSYWRPKELNRFNGPGRGAWYAALELETAIAEVAFHMTRELANVADFNTSVDYSEMFASFVGSFVDVRKVDPLPDFLHPDPEVSYRPGNAFASVVRAGGHLGILYPSARREGGSCIVALIPNAVQAVAQGRCIRLQWAGSKDPEVSVVAG